MPRQAGPQGQGEMDARLSALKSNQEYAQDQPAPEDFLKGILPLLVAQAGDIASTSNLTRLNGALNTHGDIMHTSEANPLPGMQSGLGRLGWGAGEALLAALLLKKKPALGKKVIGALAPLHGALASGNNMQANRVFASGTGFQFPQMAGDATKDGR